MNVTKELYREILEDSAYRESVINEFLQKREKNRLDIQNEDEDGFFNGKTDMYRQEEKKFFQVS